VIDKGKFVVGGGGRTEEEEEEEEEEARDTESKTRTPHKVVGKNTQLRPPFGPSVDLLCHP